MFCEDVLLRRGRLRERTYPAARRRGELILSLPPYGFTNYLIDFNPIKRAQETTLERKFMTTMFAEASRRRYLVPTWFLHGLLTMLNLREQVIN